VNKTASSAAKWQSAFCFTLIHVQLLVSRCATTNKKIIAYSTSWHNSIFSYKVRTD